MRKLPSEMSFDSYSEGETEPILRVPEDEFDIILQTMTTQVRIPLLRCRVKFGDPKLKKTEVTLWELPLVPSSHA